MVFSGTIEFSIVELDRELLSRCKDSFFDSLSRVRNVGEISSKDSSDILDSINSQDGHVFVAVTGYGNDEKIIGTTTVLVEQKFIRSGARVAHIEDVSTRKEFEGHGVAKAVMSHAISYARERGCYKVILDCSDETKGFYERLGFRANENHMRLDI